MYLSDLIFHDVNQAYGLRKEMEETESELKLRIMQTDRKLFAGFLQQQRKIVAKSILREGEALFKRLLAIDEMLVLLNSLNIEGSKHDLSLFEEIMHGYMDFFDKMCFIEDMENKRVLLSTDNRVYMLKYWNVIMQFYQTYGIVAAGESDRESVFRYAEISKQTREKKEFQLGMELGELFEQEFDFIAAIKYVFERYHRTSKLHSYDPSGLDIVVLLALSFSIKDDVEYWLHESLNRLYTINTKGKGNFGQFISEYVFSLEKAPIIVFDGEFYIVDRETILLYINYLIGRNRRMVEGQSGTGAERIMKKKQEASRIFEKYIRNHLRVCGFKVNDEPIVVSEHNEQHEYDVIGVKEDTREIVLVEAKYRDFSPSSLTGETLLQQELLDQENGLLSEAIKHQARLVFFRKYPERFIHELSLKSLFKSYFVSTWIVTKHPPLISRYKQVSITVFDDFCNSFKVR